MKPGSKQPVRERSRLCRTALVLGAWIGSLGASSLSLAPAAESNLASASKPAVLTVGMEGRLETPLPGTLLDAKPVGEKSLVIVRIAQTRPHGALTWYDLRYVALVPGRHDLRRCLVRKDGSTTEDLPPLEVEVSGLLPPSHQGELVPQSRGLARFFGGYRNVLLIAGALWLLALIPLLVAGRKKRAGPPQPAAPSPPTLVERLAPLIAKAAAGELSTDGKAQLERLLLSYWRERLGLGDQGPGEAVAALRQHPEAGALLRALEDWLHRPPGVAQVDIPALLRPYQRSAETAIAGASSPSTP